MEGGEEEEEKGCWEGGTTRAEAPSTAGTRGRPSPAFQVGEWAVGTGGRPSPAFQVGEWAVSTAVGVAAVVNVSEENPPIK